MTHYEDRLQQDLNRIRERIRAVAAEVEEALKEAVHALLTLDKRLAYSIIMNDHPINRAVREIDRLCHAFVARHLPSAGHLRFVSSVLKLIDELERIGDYAVTICRETVQLSEQLPAPVARDFDLVADQSRHILSQAVKAFDEGNAEMARGTLGMAKQVGRTFGKVFDDLLREGREGTRTIKDLFALLLIFNRLERVGDRAKNICEDTIFAVTGETKEPKTYRILFVDEKNNCASQMAEVFARKAFPASGRYASAGWNPAAAIQPALLSFMDRRGHDLRHAQPRPLDPIGELAENHVIVSLEDGIENHIPSVPYHTVLLKWALEKEPETIDDTSAEVLERIYRELALHIRELMETLRGEKAV